MIAPHGCISPTKNTFGMSGWNVRRNNGRSLSGAEMKPSSKNGNVTL